MKRTAPVLTIVLAATFGTSAFGEPGGRQADPLVAPASVTCDIDGGAEEIEVMWDAVAGAAKYSVDFECEDPTGTLEMDVEYEPEERLTDTAATVPFDIFPLEVILDGTDAWSCMAKVKGLNPPGRKQSHPQGVALCQ